MYKNNISLKNKKLKSFITKEWILLLFIFTVFSRVLGTFGAYLSLLLFPLILVKINIKKQIDITFVLLFLFSVSYTYIMLVHDLYFGVYNIIIYNLLYPVTFYAIGRYFMKHWYSQRYFIIFIIIISLALSSLSLILTDIVQNGFINISRKIVDAMGESMLAATLLGAKLSLLVAASSLILVNTTSKIEKRYKNIYIICGFIGVLAIIHLINRTGLVILLISMLLVFFYNLKNYKSKKVFSLILSLFFVSIILIITINYNPTIIEVYSARGDIGGENVSTLGGRSNRWSNSLVAIFEQPYGGGGFINDVRFYAHNFWLDVGEMTGVIPFILLLLASVINLRRNFLLIWKSSFVSSFFTSVLIALNIGFFLTCFVEPIFEGAPTYVYAYFCFWGLTSVLYQHSKFLQNNFTN